jgi:hypothetical protein
VHLDAIFSSSAYRELQTFIVIGTPGAGTYIAFPNQGRLLGRMLYRVFARNYYSIT